MSTSGHRFLRATLAAWGSWCVLACTTPEVAPAVVATLEPSPPTRDTTSADANSPPPAGPSYVGVVIAPRSVDLAAEVAGTLVERSVALGERVPQGASLARIRTPTLLAEIEAAEATVLQGRAEIAERDLVVEAADETHQLEEQLTAAGVAAREDARRAQVQLGRAHAGQRRARAQLEQQRAQLEVLRARLDGGEVRAPFEGVVATWYASEGAVVQPGDPLVRVVAADTLWTRFAVPVEELDRVQPGTRVQVVPLPAGDPMPAVVEHVAPELDLASQQMLVEAVLVGDHGLAAGQACYVGLRPPDGGPAVVPSPRRAP